MSCSIHSGPRVQKIIFYGTGRGTGFSEGTRNAVFLGKLGAGDGIRTRNPQLGKLMRYRCATPAQGEEKIVKARIRVNLIRGFRGNPRSNYPSDSEL